MTRQKWCIVQQNRASLPFQCGPFGTAAAKHWRRRRSLFCRKTDAIICRCLRPKRQTRVNSMVYGNRRHLFSLLGSAMPVAPLSIGQMRGNRHHRYDLSTLFIPHGWLYSAI